MNALRLGNTTAFFLQAAISFVVSTTGVAIAIALVPASPWVRGFLALGSLYVITSTFTLAKCIRDKQELSAMYSRFEQQTAGLPPGAPYSDASPAAWK